MQSTYSLEFQEFIDNSDTSQIIYSVAALWVFAAHPEATIKKDYYKDHYS